MTKLPFCSKKHQQKGEGDCQELSSGTELSPGIGGVRRCCWGHTRMIPNPAQAPALSCFPLFPTYCGVAYLTPRFTSRTCQTRGTHRARRSTVTCRAGCSLFPRFTLNKGKKTKQKNAHVSRRDPSAALGPAVTSL